MSSGSRLLSRLTIVAAISGVLFSIYVNRTGKKSGSIAKVNENIVTDPFIAGESSAVADPGSKHSIGAVGMIEPESELINIGTNVSGIVREVYVRPGQSVKKGDPLFLIDDREARANLSAAGASLKIADARIKEALAKVDSLKDQLNSTESLVKEGQAALNIVAEIVNRDQKLFDRNALSREELNITKNKRSEAEAKLTEYMAKFAEARDQLRLMQTDKGMEGPSLVLLRSQMEQSRIELERGQIQLDLCKVNAPIEGSVLQVNLGVGEFAQAALNNTPLMVVGDIDVLHVRAEIDESEIHRFQADKPAIASPRGQANRRIGLKLVRVEPLVTPKQVLTGSTSQRIDTRVLQVVYALDSKEKSLSSGQQMDVFIQTDIP